MNDIIRAMEERRSIRSFKPEMPPKEDIEQIIEAGLYAPSGRGEQATIILAVTNKKIRDMFSESNRLIGGMKKETDPFHGAPVILIVLGDKPCDREYAARCALTRTWQYLGPQS